VLKQRTPNVFFVLLLLWLTAATAFPRFPEQPEDVSQLELSYRIYNEEYFDNRLPREVIIYWDASLGVDELGVTSRSQSTEQFVVRLSLNLQFSEALTRMVLLHEMVHIKLWGVTRGHGQPFQDEMLSLAKKGAFQNLW